MDEIATPNALAATEESAPSTTEETAAPAEISESAPEADAPVETTVNEGSEPQSKAVKELIHQRKQRQQAELEAAYWKGIAEGRGRQTEPAQPPPVVDQPPQAPAQDQFDTWEDYEKARDEYILAQTEYRMTKKYEEGMRVKAEQEAFASFQRKLEKAAETDPDIIELQQDTTLPVSGVMKQLIIRSDVGPDILRWIDNHREDATRIYHLHPIDVARELGAIEYQLKHKPKAQPPKKVSAAPEPIKTVTPVGTATVDEDTLPMDEWVKRRNATQFRRR